MKEKLHLNNKGLTIIEIIACISIVTIIVLSMLKTVTTYNDREEIESIKTTIFTKKNIITKTINDDIIAHKGVTNIETTRNSNVSVDATLTFYDGSTASFKVEAGDSNRYIEYNDEKFYIPKDYGLQFNKIYISDDQYDLFHIQVGAYSDITDIGDKYSLLDITTPNVSVSKYSSMFS